MEALSNKSCLQSNLAHLGITLAGSARRVKGVKIGRQAISQSLGMALAIVTKVGVCLETQVVIHNAQVMGGVHLHVRACRRAPLCISQTAGRIVLKLGV